MVSNILYFLLYISVLYLDKQYFKSILNMRQILKIMVNHASNNNERKILKKNTKYNIWNY